MFLKCAGETLLKSKEKTRLTEIWEIEFSFFLMRLPLACVKENKEPTPLADNPT